ncbi:hypothetical protein OYE22_23940 [Streptomyces sp. 71268]|uniref:hypothetical protein n=1 Tax=Streptomyces sp. 71268 TaxID=3002640 RepID=UPI0023F7907D|nr:hypothetical protein [Streptomyces sp. 71268]WEV27885.1 hypothetical protein OYE22_23940 [Streptomyces sp. 71268]
MGSPTISPTPVRLRLAALVAAPVLALSVACGGDDSGGTRSDDDIASVPQAPSASRSAPDTRAPDSRTAGKSAFYDAQLSYVQCMRAKGGYPDFPDPKLSGYLDWKKVNAIGSQPGRNEGIKGGRNGVCVSELRKTMDAEPKRDQQKDYESMLAHAKCMRDNGVSRFTNPTMSGGNAQPGGDPNPGSPVIDIESPAYEQAREACKGKLLEGLDGMQ